jgi:HD superfamily phosphohydrolase
VLRPGRIRDPIHGYIPFTAVERALLDDPVAQRLRYVTQSAAAHLVFPDMRVSRMAHSLGAMHLASRFLAASLGNARNDERRLLLEGFRALVAREQQLGLGQGAETALLGQGLIAARDVDAGDRLVVLLIEQGLRLASLVHDLGHLPFSHDFELALDDHLRGDPADAARFPRLIGQAPGGHDIHERVGYQLADVVQEHVFNRALADQPIAKPAEVALLIARRILHAPAVPELVDEPVDLALSWLHELVAGEIDVDRADYVLRDVRHYGLASAGYDIDRLVANLTVVLTPEHTLQTAVLPQGVSAAEELLVARFRMYAWAVYHHKVQQAAAGLRVTISYLLREGGDVVRHFLADIDALAGGEREAELVERFVGYDDVWWTGIMRAALRDGADENVEPWLALFLQRRPGPVSLWKRPAEFPVEDRGRWNRRLPPMEDLERRNAFEDTRRSLRNDGVLVERLPFRPWKSRPDGSSRLAVADRDGTVRPLSRLSSLVGALEEAWTDEIQILAFADRPDRTTAAEVLAAIEPTLLPEEPT